MRTPIGCCRKEYTVLQMGEQTLVSCHVNVYKLFDLLTVNTTTINYNRGTCFYDIHEKDRSTIQMYFFTETHSCG